MDSRKSWRILKFLIVIGLVIVITGLYLYGAIVQLARVNTDMHSTDQTAYMGYARNLYESNYTFVGGRNRMPLYPMLQSLFYRPDLTDEAFFARGKYFNLFLSLGLMAGLALIFRQYFSWLTSVNMLLITAFTVFIFKAGYFQAELLFYFVNFCLFLLMFRLLQKESWRLAIVTGIVAGLAHLTKASIFPGLLVFLVLGVVKWGREKIHSRLSSGAPAGSKLPRSTLFGLLLTGVFFLITVSPYISTSKRVFGHYFYNVNSTFYIWYDSWEEAVRGTQAHGDRIGWPSMPIEQIPSMSRYVREHTLGQMASRFVYGGRMVLSQVLHSYGYFKHILFYLSLLLISILRSRQRAKHLVMSNPILCMFLVMYFSGYILLYSWYAPIASGNRFVLALFLPLMFSISYGLEALLRSSNLRAGRHSVPTLLVNNLAILILVIADIYFVLTERVGTIYGGL